MRILYIFIPICIYIMGCKQSTVERDQLTSKEDTIGKYLLERAQLDIEKTQGSTFNIFTDQIPTHRYVVDTTHSSVQFSVRHWGIYDVIGRIESYEMVIHYDRVDFTDMIVEVRLRPTSINMPNKEMANHLKIDKFGFFEVTKFPTIVYKSTKIELVSDSIYKLTGDMTIKDTTKEVVFDVTFNGYADPQNRKTPGFTIIGKINRLDFDLGGAELLPGNGLPMIGNVVYIRSNIRLIGNYD